MAEYRYYLIPDAMTRAFPEQFEKQTPTEFFDNIADLKKRYSASFTISRMTCGMRKSSNGKRSASGWNALSEWTAT